MSLHIKLKFLTIWMKHSLKMGAIQVAHVVECVLYCTFSQQVWKEVFGWMGVEELNKNDGVMDMFKFSKLIKEKKVKRVKHLIWLANTWNIWLINHGTILSSMTWVMLIKSLMTSKLYRDRGFLALRTKIVIYCLLIGVLII